MPSEILQAEIVVTDTTVEMVFDQLLGDEVIEAGDSDPFEERLIGTSLLYTLERLCVLGVSDIAISPRNRLTFSYLPGLNALELAARAAGVLGRFHGKTTIVLFQTR